MCRVEFSSAQVKEDKTMQTALKTVAYECKCGQQVLLEGYNQHVESG